MAFGQRRSSNYGGTAGPGAQNYTSVRLTGLFATKKPGLLVGTIEGEALDGLIEKIKDAVAKGKGIALFVREVEQPKGNYVAQIFADVDTRDAGARPAQRRAIQPDPAPAPQQPKTESYDPFRNR